ncbi:MAG: group II intron reverse transcriptase/maturase [Verrucomicrobiales bacterium]
MNREPEAMLEQLMERAVHPDNWEASLSAVERNKGAPGPDGMKAHELRAHLAIHGEVIKRRLLTGRYQPAASRRRDIAKPGGGTRPLSIPNVQDRFVQQLLLGAMQPEFDARFSESSYGFRPGRSQAMAVRAAQALAREGYTWIVDMDITKFFDHVNHDILMHRIAEVVRDKRVLRLIGAFLRAGVVMPDGLKVSSEEGTPQGGPLSPLLANIYLDSLDKELEKRGLRFARYADDCNIYVRSEAAARRIMSSLSGWIARHLRLEVSEKKSGVGRPWERKFLGFTFTTLLMLTIASSSLIRFEDKVRELWNARQPRTSIELRDQWRSYVQGWWGYYRLTQERRPIFRKEGWIRRHIRKCFWIRWHNSRGRLRALRRLNIPPQRVDLAQSSRGAWRLARHPVMQEALNNRLLKRLKFVMPSDLAG